MTTEYIYYDLHTEVEKFKKLNEENNNAVDTVNRYNKHKIREDFKELLMANLHISELEVNDLEIGIFNATIDYANNSKVQLSWKCQMFLEIYTNIARSIYSNIKKDSYIGNDNLYDRMINKKSSTRICSHICNAKIYSPRDGKRLMSVISCV